MVEQVVDASVAMKWVFKDENYRKQARTLVTTRQTEALCLSRRRSSRAKRTASSRSESFAAPCRKLKRMSEMRLLDRIGVRIVQDERVREAARRIGAVSTSGGSMMPPTRRSPKFAAASYGPPTRRSTTRCMPASPLLDTFAIFAHPKVRHPREFRLARFMRRVLGTVIPFRLASRRAAPQRYKNPSLPLASPPGNSQP